ncbi:MAG: GAF domain-containing protein [Chloroflexi bacterium]|nr:GAF domain-containing protein [Chloroflexota bacterium]
MSTVCGKYLDEALDGQLKPSRAWSRVSPDDVAVLKQYAIVGLLVASEIAETILDHTSHYDTRIENVQSSTDVSRLKVQYSAYFTRVFTGEKFVHDPSNSDFVSGLKIDLYLESIPKTIEKFESLVLAHQSVSPVDTYKLVGALSKKLWADAIDAYYSSRLIERDTVKPIEINLADQTAIFEMAIAISSSNSIDSGFATFSRSLQNFFGAERSVVSVFRPGTWTITDNYMFDLENGHVHATNLSLVVPENLASYLNTRSARHLDRNIFEKYADQFPPFAGRVATQSGSAITIIIWRGDVAAGALTLFGSDTNIFSDGEIQQLESVATHVSGAIGHLLTNRELEAGLARESILSEIGQIVGSAMDIGSVFSEVVSVLKRLFEFDEGVITYADIEAGTYSLLFHESDRKVANVDDYRFQLKNSHTAMVMASQEPVVVRVAPDGEEKEGTLTIVDAEPRGIRSACGVALISDGVPFGGIHFRSSSNSAFDSISKELFLQISAQVSGAIAYHQVNDRLSTELREQSTLSLISRILGPELDLATAFSEVAQILQKLIPFNSMFASYMNSEVGTLTYLYRIVNGRTDSQIGVAIPLIGSTAEVAIDSQKPQRISVGTDGSWGGGRLLKRSAERGERSVLVVPLISEGKVLGVLHFHSGQENAYDDLGDDFVELLASHLAGTIAYQKINDQLKIEVREQSLLAQIGQIFSASSDIHSNFDEFAETLRSMIEFDTVFVNSINHDTGEITDRFVSGALLDGTKPGIVGSLAGTLTERTIENALPTRSDTTYTRIHDFGFLSGIAIPIVDKGSVIGTLQLRSKLENAFPSYLDRFLTLVADQISGAIARTELTENETFLTEERNRSERLGHQNEQLVQTQQIRDQFLGMVSHELRTPLTSISAFTDILGRNKEETLTDRQLQHLAAVARNANQLTGLIDDLILMSKMESDQFELTKNHSNIVELVREVCESMTPVVWHRNQKLDIQTKNHDFNLDIDSARMTQVLNNLISNASKFSPKDSTISVRIEKTEINVQIEISDEGPGIDQSDIESVFNPFYRSENEIAKLVPGTGLGLYVARMIVTQHGGEIAVVPDAPVGMTIRILLPTGAHLRSAVAH